MEFYDKWQKGHRPEEVLDAGIGYFVSSNVKVDVIAGKGLNKAAPDYFIGTGLSFRIKP